MPPKAKVYEALSAVAGGRVHLTGLTSAEVVSSAGDKTYTVTWNENMSRVSSNDNASYWQGYAGYPIVAILLVTGVIPYDPDVARPLADVRWKAINDQFKRDYDKAVDEVLRRVEREGASPAAIASEVDAIYLQLAALKLERGSREAPPPKA